MARSIEIANALITARWTHAKAPPPTAGPIETASEFEAHFAERNVLGLSLDEARLEAERELAGCAPRHQGYSFGLSTGTTGRPGVFITHERERNAWLGAVLGKFLPLKMLLGGADVALILKHNNQLYTDVTKARGLRLHYFDATFPIGDWAERLCTLAPQVLAGPPSLLERVSRTEAFARRPFRPGLLLTGAEPLFKQDRALLQGAYGILPRVIYQAKEGFLAAECRHGGIHLNEDLIHFDMIPLGRDRFVPVITDSTRTSQTYKRFRLDDVLIRSRDTCACGNKATRIAAVEGRAQDVMLFGAGERLFPMEVNEMLLPLLDGRDYQITQVANSRMLFAVEGVAPPLAAVKVLGEFARVEPTAYSSPAPGEKRRRIRRLFDLQNDWLRIAV